MALSAPRLALASLLLSSSVAHAGWFDFMSSDKPAAPAEKPAAATATAGTSLDDSIREAQTLRLAGNYQDAIKHLSQVMMVASDDGRVISEYGKTLAAMGRAQDAISFLTRAVQLQPNEWSSFSALGVAYDQVGNQKDAQSAYEHALILKPEEPSVLSNYALSRLLAHDPEMAKTLAVRAETANTSAKDGRIAANIAMIRSMAPKTPDPVSVASTPAPASTQDAPAQVASRAPVTMAPLPKTESEATVEATTAGDAPRPLTPPTNAGTAEPQVANGVVMQRVPVDPLAGPYASAGAKNAATAKKAAAKNGAGAKSAASQAEELQAHADALAKQLTNKPDAIAEAKTEANKKTEAAKPVAPHVVAGKTTTAPAKAADAKSAARVTLEMPATASAPVKTATAPKVLPPAGTPASAQASAQAPTKTAVKSRENIPGLRMSANAY